MSRYPEYDGMDTSMRVAATQLRTAEDLSILLGDALELCHEIERTAELIYLDLEEQDKLV